MKCLEIRINGELVCTAGAKDLNQLQTTLILNIERLTPFLAVNGAKQTDTHEFEHLEWLEKSLSEKDELTIRFVDCDKASQPTTVKQIDRTDSYEEYEQKVAQEMAKLRMSKKDSDLN